MSATVSDFTSETLGTTIAGGNATYTPTEATTSGSATVVKSAGVGGADGGAVQTATDVTGNNSASWDAEVALAVPSDALASDDYVATITHSVA
ncbi:hypothetical protein P9139_11200 [Curtobacterium flaccumfaciens]|nr:hypothetical protein P9139_11200 [Curtobacterium flaccumfaciens]